jgi:hypothetical protein
VAGYLSDEWFEQLGATEVSAAGAPGETLVIQHVVTASPRGDVAYYVRVADHSVAIVRGRAEHPDVTFAEDYATAAAIAGGGLSAPAALLAGRIRVAGDMAALIAHQDLLAVHDPVPASVRAATTY